MRCILLSTKADLKRLVAKRLGWKFVGRAPGFMSKYKWQPHYFFRSAADKKYIAVDIVYDDQWSRKIYENEAARAMRENKSLEVCLFTPFYSAFERLQGFCGEQGFGLKVFTGGTVTSILGLSFEKVRKAPKRGKEPEGWFPQSILEGVKGIDRLRFKGELHRLAQRLEADTSHEGQLANIKRGLDVMLMEVPYLPADSLPFMKLSHFESLLDCSNIQHSDHVFHSARVFLVGCIVIDRFYNQFVDYYHQILTPTSVNVEYMWLLTALFHDIGRVMQDTWRIYLPDPSQEDSDLKAQVCEQMCKRWKQPEYMNALCNIVELVKQSKGRPCDRDIPWTGYALGGPVDEEVKNVFVQSYNSLGSHGVIGCFEFAADILQKLVAVRSQGRTFPLYHVFPAMLAVALHHHKVWADLREIGVFPIAMRDFPLPALLIYIDTWDDYKRAKGRGVSIDEIAFDANGVTVQVTWSDPKAYRNDRIKYDSFRENVIFDDISLKIRVSGEGS
jgi:hypothetical protein